MEWVTSFVNNTPKFCKTFFVIFTVRYWGISLIYWQYLRSAMSISNIKSLLWATSRLLYFFLFSSILSTTGQAVFSVISFLVSRRVYPVYLTLCLSSFVMLVHDTTPDRKFSLNFPSCLYHFQNLTISYSLDSQSTALCLEGEIPCDTWEIVQTCKYKDVYCFNELLIKSQFHVT